MRDLTPRQFEILDFIVHYMKEYMTMPSIREVCRHFGFTTNAAFDHYKAIDRKGYLEARGINKCRILTEKAKRLYGLYFSTLWADRQ